MIAGPKKYFFWFGVIGMSQGFFAGLTGEFKRHPVEQLVRQTICPMIISLGAVDALTDNQAERDAGHRGVLIGFVSGASPYMSGRCFKLIFWPQYYFR